MQAFGRRNLLFSVNTVICDEWILRAGALLRRVFFGAFSEMKQVQVIIHSFLKKSLMQYLHGHLPLSAVLEQSAIILSNFSV